MIIYKLMINKYSWTVTILYKCYHHDLPQIKDHLSSIGCSAVLIQQATDILTKSKFNTGLTYSRFLSRNSVMVLNETTNIEEMINSITHECYHLVQHINKYLHIDNKEELATLAGNLCMNMYILLGSK